MKDILAIGFGLLLILAACLIALNQTSEDTLPEPRVAAVLATQLHSSPTVSLTPTVRPTHTPAPTPTLTPAPTVTTIPSWVKFSTPRLELWLPPEYRLGRSEGTVSRRYFGARFAGTLDLSAFDTTAGGGYAPRVQIIALRASRAIRPVTAKAQIAQDSYEQLQPVWLGRYPAWRAVTSAPGPSGIRLKELVYWIQVGDAEWLAVFSTPEEDAARDMPVFDRSIRSLTLF